MVHVLHGACSTWIKIYQNNSVDFLLFFSELLFVELVVPVELVKLVELVVIFFLIFVALSILLNQIVKM